MTWRWERDRLFVVCDGCGNSFSPDLSGGQTIARHVLENGWLTFRGRQEPHHPLTAGSDTSDYHACDDLACQAAMRLGFSISEYPW